MPGARVSINVDLNSFNQQVLARVMALSSDLTDKAGVRALNKVAAQAKTAASREIRAAGYNMKAARIKDRITVRPATAGNPVAIVRCSGRPIPLVEFSARETKAGVTVSVKNGRKAIKGAFIATMPSGHRGVFVRVGKAHKKMMVRGKAAWHGLPIKELYGPAIPDAFGNDVVQQALVRLIKDKYPAILAHEIEFLRRR